MFDPLWARAPLQLFRRPFLLAAFVATTSILVLAGAIGPLFLSATGSAALRSEMRDSSPSSEGLSISLELPFPKASLVRPGLSAAGPSIKTTRLLQLQAARLKDVADDIPGLGRAISSVLLPGLPIAGTANEIAPVGAVLGRTGVRDHLSMVDSTPGRGFAISDVAADAYGIRMGDIVTIGDERTASIRINGIYRSLTGASLAGYWEPVRSLIVPPQNKLGPDSGLPTLLLSTPRAAARLAGSLGANANARWEFPLEASEISLDKASRLADDVEEGARVIRDARLGDGYELFGAIAFDEIRGRLYDEHFTVATGSSLHSSVVAARQVTDPIRSPVLMFQLGGVVLGLALVYLTGFLVVRQRSTEFQLLSSRGTHPVLNAARAGTEGMLPALIAGSVSLLSLNIAFRVGGLTVDAGAQVAAGMAALGVLLCALIVYAVSVSATAERLFPVTVRQKRTRKALIYGSLAVTWILTTATMLVVKDPSADTSSWMLVIVPLLALVPSGAVTVALAKAGVRHIRTRSTARSTYLAVRRIAAPSNLFTACGIAAVTAMGLMIYAAMVVSSARATLYAKSHVFVGSDVATYVPDPEFVPDTSFPATTVWRMEDVPSDRGQVDVIAIDPGSFSSAAYWDNSFSDSSLSALVRGLRGGDGDALPVVVAGRIEDPTEVTLDDLRVDVEDVGTANVFPGMHSDPLIVVEQTALRRQLGGLGGVDVAAFVWSKGAPAAILQDLKESGVLWVRDSITAPAVSSSPFLRSLSWMLAVLRGFAVAIGLLAVSILLLHLAFRLSRQLLGYGLARRMGLSRREHRTSLALETGFVVVTGLIGGTVTGALYAVLGYGLLDLLPNIPPDSLLRFPVSDLAGGLVVGLATVVIGALWLQRKADQTNLGELLRR